MEEGNVQLEQVLNRLESHANGNHESPALSQEAIRSGDRYALIHHVVSALDEGRTLLEPVVQTIFSRVFADSSTKKDQVVIRANQSDKAQLKRLSQYEKGDEKIGEWDVFGLIKPAISEGTSKTFPDGLIDHGEEHDRDALATVAFTMFERLPLEQRRRLINYIGSSMATTKLKPERSEELREELLGDAQKPGVLDGDQSHELYDVFLESFFTNAPDYKYGEEAGTPLNDLLDYALDRKRTFVPDAVSSIASFPDELQTKAIGVLVDRFGYARILNAIRWQIDNVPPTKERDRLVRLGKTLFGFLPDDTLDFHTKLNQVYEAWNFSKYEANQNAQQFDIDLLESHIGKVDKEASLIVDLGSGTGRLANQLAFKFPGKKIVGIEASVENIMKAEKEAGELGITGKVEYLAEDWKQPDVLHGRKADIVYSLGRSLTHAESHEDLDKTLASIVDMLNMGGVFIFDLPDPNVGVVLKRRREIANKMRSLGIPIAEIPIPDRPGETMPESDIIVDSPDGRNFYNRRVPQLAEIARMLKFHGLSFEVIAREPIVGAGYLADDRNIYIRAKKIEKGTLESLRESRAFLKMIVNQQGPLPKPGSKVPSLSGQSPDGEL